MLVGVLGAAEVAILYVLIAVETPVSPLVLRLVERPIGILLLALFGVSIIIVGMWGLTAWAERVNKRQERTDRAANGRVELAGAATAFRLCAKEPPMKQTIRRCAKYRRARS